MGEVGEPSAEIMAEYHLSVAARFWGCPAWELEERDDGAYWVTRAIAFQSAEATAQEIMREAADKRIKK